MPINPIGWALRRVLGSYGEFVGARQIIKGIQRPRLQQVLGKIFPDLNLTEINRLIGISRLGVNAGRRLSALARKEIINMAMVPVNEFLGSAEPSGVTSRIEAEVWVEELGRNIRVYVDNFEGSTLDEVYRAAEDMARQIIGDSPGGFGVSDPDVTATTVRATVIRTAFTT
jgi:hypothetical protein